VPLYTDSTAWENVKLDLAELKAKPSLIIIDTMTRLITGLDENSAKDASMVTKFMEQLARYYECFVLAIHHTGKDQNKGARGSSAFYANMDTVISTRLKQGGTELRVKKQKDADVSDEISCFAVKEMGHSIVLARTEMLDDLNPKKQPAATPGRALRKSFACSKGSAGKRAIPCCAWKLPAPTGSKGIWFTNSFIKMMH
jgi:hypothetical protein